MDFMHIAKIRDQVGCVIRKCLGCRKIELPTLKATDPPPLPKDRLSFEKPFTISASISVVHL